MAMADLRRPPPEVTLKLRILARQGMIGPGRLTEREMSAVYAEVVAKLRRRRRKSSEFSVCVFLFRRPGRVTPVVYEECSNHAEAERGRQGILWHWLGNYSQSSNDSRVLDDVVRFNNGR